MPPKAKRGMSREEKLTALQQLIMESGDVWTLKDLEKDAPKKKGIVQQMVKEILDELCDSDLVSRDKIGTQNFFWCFAADATKARQSLIEQYIAAEQRERRELAAMEEGIAKLVGSRRPSPEREQLDSDISALEAEVAKLNAEIKELSALDPTAVRAAERRAAEAREAAIRWTDNVSTIRSWLRKNRGMEGREFDRQLELEDGFFDYE